MDELFLLLISAVVVYLCMRQMLHNSGYYYDGEEADYSGYDDD